MRRTLFAALCFGLMLVPRPAHAQGEPPRTKEIKEAEKLIAIGMLTTDTVERRARVEKALKPLQEAMAKNPENARVWLLNGQAAAALRDLPRADSLLKTAEQMYPAFADDINETRVQTWAEAFTASLTMMDEKKFDEALATLLLAERMYSLRPESKMNLGVLYANKGDVVSAQQQFEAALAAATGPLKDGLKPEEAARWQHYALTSKTNIAQMASQQGVEAFEAKRYDDAMKFFQQARELNPLSRDFAYNLAQSIYAKAAQLEEARAQLLKEEKAAKAKKDAATARAKSEAAARIAEQLVGYYAQVEPLVVAARTADPSNQDLFLLQARSYRIRGSLTTDAAQQAEFDKRVNALLKEHEALPIEVTSLIVTSTDSTAVIRGQVNNRKATAGAPVKLHFTLFALDGTKVGEQDVTVAAPAVGAAANFEESTRITGDVTAWKYEILQ